MRDDRAVAGLPRQGDRVQRLSQRADLVDLDQDRVGDAAGDALLQARDVRDEEIVANELDPVPDRIGQMLPAIPVVFRHPVLDRDDRIAGAPVLIELDERRRIERSPFALELVLAFLVELARRGVEGDRHILARLITGLLDCLHDQLQRVFVGAQVRRKTALIPHSGRQALLLQHALERLVDLGDRAHRFAEPRCADRAHHELLQVDRRVGVRAAVEDVGHRQREKRSAVAAQVSIERNSLRLRRRMRDGEGCAENRVGAQAGLVGRAVELDERLVDTLLVADIEVLQPAGDLPHDVADRLRDALAAIAFRVAVAQLDRLVHPRRCARGHDRPTDSFIRVCGDGDRGIATRIEHLEGRKARQPGHETEV